MTTLKPHCWIGAVWSDVMRLRSTIRRWNRSEFFQIQTVAMQCTNSLLTYVRLVVVPTYLPTCIFL